MAILNLGCGSNPMAGAVNVDIRPSPGVDIIADVNRLPFADTSFTEVHAINPHGYYPVAMETARILQSGGLLYVTGAGINKRAQPLLAGQARALGFVLVQTLPIILAHKFGVQRTTLGREIKTHTSKTTIYRRLP